MKLLKFESTIDRLGDRRAAHVARLRVRTFFASHEAVARQAFAYTLHVEREIVGYALIASMRPASALAGRLLEFALDPGYDDLLIQIRNLFRLDAVHVRSDDAASMRFANLCQLEEKSIAPIFEVSRDIAFVKIPETTVALLPERHLEKAEELVKAEGGDPKELGDAEVWAFYRGADLVGIARVVPQPVPEYVTLEPIIRKDARRKGCGRLFYGTLAAKQRLAGRRVVATMSWDNSLAVAFVRSMGLEQIGEHLLFTRRNP